MIFRNTIEFEIYGGCAMFTDPVQKSEGILCSYPVPTYEAVKGILRSVYWKPTFIWVPDKLRVMNRISFESFPVKQRREGRVFLTEKRRLIGVRYQLRAHFVWNENRPELAGDRDEDKHFRIALRSLSRGGRRSIYLGTGDCVGYVRSARFGSGKSFYDGCDQDFWEMYHGITYPDENMSGQRCMDVLQRSFRCVMRDGVITFPPPEECSSSFLRQGAVKRFGEMPVNV
ncbi:MAG: type I-C CRISPR-associated protein Cas5c [Oscillospiraceae bacterium]